MRNVTTGGRKAARAAGYLLRREPGLQPAVDFDLAEEHRVRTHPEAAVVVERSVQHQRLQRFAVPCHPDHLVLAALVVAVASGPGFGKRGEIAHLAAFILFSFTAAR